MEITSIHQFLPVFAKYDAIGKTVSQIKKTLENLGYNSEIFVEKPIPETSKTSKIFTEYEEKKSDLIIYHHSIGSSLSSFMQKITSPKIMFYHNITHPSFFEPYDSTIATQLFEGLEQTKNLSNSFSFSMAASKYNKSNLNQLGYTNIFDAQYFINLNRFDTLEPKKEILEKFKNTTNIIFVGRRVPNKKVEDVIKVFAYYKVINPNSKLFLLGGSWSIEKYVNELNDLRIKLGLDSDDIITIDSLTDVELKSYFQIADLFLCMSEHEGFCIPLVESMYFDVPIVAYNSTAVPDTLGG